MPMASPQPRRLLLPMQGHSLARLRAPGAHACPCAPHPPYHPPPQGYPQKLGFLLWGPPGTGKTSFIKALATHTGRSIVSIPLARVRTNQVRMRAPARGGARAALGRCGAERARGIGPASPRALVPSPRQSPPHRHAQLLRHT